MLSMFIEPLLGAQCFSRRERERAFHLSGLQDFNDLFRRVDHDDEGEQDAQSQTPSLD